MKAKDRGRDGGAQISEEELKNEPRPEKERDPLSIYSCLVYLFMYSLGGENFVIHLSAAAVAAANMPPFPHVGTPAKFAACTSDCGGGGGGR